MPTAACSTPAPGRAWWAVELVPPMSRVLRMKRGCVKEVVGTDVDAAALSNSASTQLHVVALGEPLPFDDDGFGMVVADYVLEHVNRKTLPIGRPTSCASSSPVVGRRTDTQQRWGSIVSASGRLRMFSRECSQVPPATTSWPKTCSRFTTR